MTEALRLIEWCRQVSRDNECGPHWRGQFDKIIAALEAKGAPEPVARFSVSRPVGISYALMTGWRWEKDDYFESLPDGEHVLYAAAQVAPEPPAPRRTAQPEDFRREPGEVYPTARSGQGPEAAIQGVRSFFSPLDMLEMRRAETQRSDVKPSEPDGHESGVGGTPVEPLRSLLEELRIQCSWLTGADYSNAMTLLDRIETALHQSETPDSVAGLNLVVGLSPSESEPAQAGAVQRPVDDDQAEYEEECARHHREWKAE